MKRSPEIEKEIRDSVAAFARGDFSVVERTTSKQPGVVSIGTAPEEYQRGYDQIVGQLRHEVEATPQIRYRVGEVNAFEQGDVGWADGTATFEAEGKTVETRVTSVHVREDGQWRTVQAHVSIGVPNEHMFDATLRSRATAK